MAKFTEKQSKAIDVLVKKTDIRVLRDYRTARQIVDLQATQDPMEAMRIIDMLFERAAQDELIKAFEDKDGFADASRVEQAFTEAMKRCREIKKS